MSSQTSSLKREWLALGGLEVGSEGTMWKWVRNKSKLA